LVRRRLVAAIISGISSRPNFVHGFFQSAINQLLHADGTLKMHFSGGFDMVDGVNLNSANVVQDAAAFQWDGGKLEAGIGIALSGAGFGRCCFMPARSRA
jgi:hypothetical protein